MRLRPTRRQVLAGGVLAPLAGAARAAPAPGISAAPSFSETFGAPLSVVDRATGKGRWKTNYWFGDQNAACSRSLPQEKEIYVDREFCGIDPFRQSEAGLTIIAAKNARPSDPRLFNPYTGRKQPFPYTSGLITTETSFRQRYGYFEARMSFPQVRGCWPAFWLLGPPNGPHAGDEIDVIEWVASNPKRLFFNAHLAGQANSKWIDGYDTARLMTYAVLWTPDRLAWMVNGSKVHEQANPGLHEPMYMLLNLAIGGWDNNLPEDPSGFPAALHVASVKAYRLA